MQRKTFAMTGHRFCASNVVKLFCCNESVVFVYAANEISENILDMNLANSNSSFPGEISVINLS
jgi:hypothetical protein